MFFSWFFVICKSKTFNISAIGNNFTRLAKGDVLHLEMGETKDAFLVFSKQIKSFSIDGVNVSGSYNYSFKVTGRTADYFADEDSIEVFVWLIPKNKCSQNSFMTTGSKYQLKAKQFNDTEHICFFPVSTAISTEIKYRTIGGNTVIFRNLQENYKCDEKVEYSREIENPVFFRFPKNVKYFEYTMNSIGEQIYNDMMLLPFVDASRNGFNYTQLEIYSEFEIIPIPYKDIENTFNMILFIGALVILAFVFILTLLLIFKDKCACCSKPEPKTDLEMEKKVTEVTYTQRAKTPQTQTITESLNPYTETNQQLICYNET